MKFLGKLERVFLERLQKGSFPAGGGVLLSALNAPNPLLSACYLAECLVSVDEIPQLFSRAGIKAYRNLLAKRLSQMFALVNHKD
jgi:hypothetical protein